MEFFLYKKINKFTKHSDLHIGESRGFLGSLGHAIMLKEFDIKCAGVVVTAQSHVDICIFKLMVLVDGLHIAILLGQVHAESGSKGWDRLLIVALHYEGLLEREHEDNMVLVGGSALFGIGISEVKIFDTKLVIKFDFPVLFAQRQSGASELSHPGSAPDVVEEIGEGVGAGLSHG